MKTLSQPVSWLVPNNVNFRTAHVCVSLCTTVIHTAQHTTVPIIFTLNLLTNIVALMLSVGGEVPTKMPRGIHCLT